MEPLISVLIPTFNRPNELMRAIKSVISQTYSKIEIVISDNSSDLRSQEKLSQIDFRNRKLIYNRNKENIGPILNWKKAIELSTGKYCIVLPDDDFLINPFYFEDAINAFKCNNVKLVFTSCIFGHKTSKHSIGGRENCQLINGIDFIKGFWKEYHIPTFANLFEKDLTREMEFFHDNDFLYSDIEFWLKSLALSDVYFYNIPSVYYTFHDSNIVKNMNHNSLIKNSKFISNVIDFYIRNELPLNQHTIKSQLITKYVLFTNSIYSFFSFNYFIQILKINNYKLTDLRTNDIVFFFLKSFYRMLRRVLL